MTVDSLAVKEKARTEARALAATRGESVSRIPRVADFCGDVARAMIAGDIRPVSRADALHEPLVGITTTSHPTHERVALVVGDDGIEEQASRSVRDVVTTLHLKPPTRGSVT